MNKVKLIIPIIGLLFSMQLFAQNPISGIVTDASTGEPLLGTTIMIKGTGNGTITDIDGSFSLQVDSEDAILSVSFLGYVAQEIPIGNQTTINIQLAPNTESLDELVVVGYGVQKKADLTGSVSSIKTEDLSTIPVSNASQALQGKAAGVNVSQSTGSPGAGISVRIRGVGSINSSNSPLYIVDGIPTTDALNSLSASDIESISILKDASSAAIYGSRANNGVVLITTKKGKSGKAAIHYNTQFGVQQHGKLTEMTNSAEYVEMYNEAADNDNEGVTNASLLRDVISDEYAATLPDVDHLEAIFRKALIQSHDLSISGGNDKMKYFVSGSYYDQEGIIINSDYQRSTGKVNLSVDATDWLTLNADMNMSFTKRNIIGSSGDGYGGNGGGIVRYALFRCPTINIYDDNGDYVDLPDNSGYFGDGYNPVGLANNTYNVKKGNRIFSNFNATIKFTKDLNLVSTFGIDKLNTNQRRFNKTWGTDDRINDPNSLEVTDCNELIWTWSNALSYNKTINDVHNLSFMVGSELVSWDGYSHYTIEKDFADQDIDLVYLGNGTGITNTSESQEGYTLASFFGRANYNYDNRYLASATIRRDGSSRFGDKNKWGTFYSFSGAWRIDGESFFDDVDFMNMLKLRAGYGAIGNQEIGNYAYSNEISYGYNYVFGGTSNEGYTQTKLGNSDVKWETSTQIDIGIDAGFFEGQINFTADYFRKVTNDMLVKASIPASAGEVEESWVNNGSVLNTGFEFELSYRKILKNWDFSVTGNLATLKNEVLELDDPITNMGRIDNGTYAIRVEEGHSLGAFYLYEMEGIFQNDIEVVSHANQGTDVAPGDVMFKNQNDDTEIDEDDRTFVGSSIPKFTYGLNLSVGYKDFDFSAFFQGVQGNKIYYQVATDIEGFYRPFNLTKRYYDEHWTGEGTSNTQPRASWDAKQNNCKPSTRFLEDGSYLRLKTVQLGYSLPKDVVEKMHLGSLRVYASGQNLLTFTKYPGLDPEMTASDNASDEGDNANNIDWGTYPSAITMSLGLQLTF